MKKGWRKGTTKRIRARKVEKEKGMETTEVMMRTEGRNRNGREQ